MQSSKSALSFLKRARSTEATKKVKEFLDPRDYGAVPNEPLTIASNTDRPASPESSQSNDGTRTQPGRSREMAVETAREIGHGKED